MLVTVVEPSYFFPQKEFAKALQADCVIWANTFRFRRHSTINRAAIKTIRGAHWLTIPVSTEGLAEQAISKTKIHNQSEWNKTHAKTLEINYHIAPYYEYYLDELDAVFAKQWNDLDRFLVTMCRAIVPAQPFAHMKAGSELPACVERTQRIIEWLQVLHGDSYLLWPGELALVDVPRLQSQGVRLYTFQYTAPLYHQSFSDFTPNLAMIDLLFNEGPASSGYLRQAGKVIKA